MKCSYQGLILEFPIRSFDFGLILLAFAAELESNNDFFLSLSVVVVV